MRCGVLILPEQRWAQAVQRWRAAEEMGFDSAWTYDHLWWDPLQHGAWFPAFPVLAAAAAATSSIRLGTLVTSPSFRHPVTTAKDVVTVDDISGGRFTLGIGAGAENSGDAAALGAQVQRRERTERFEEFVDLSDELLRNEVTNYRGKFYSAVDVRMTPGCRQLPRVPIAVAAAGRRGIELAARRGDAYVSLGPPDLSGKYTPEDVREIVGQQLTELSRACERAGTDFDGMAKIYATTGYTGDFLESPEKFLRTAESYAAAGVTELVVHWPRESGVYAADFATFEKIAEEALPRIRRL